MAKKKSITRETSPPKIATPTSGDESLAKNTPSNNPANENNSPSAKSAGKRRNLRPDDRALDAPQGGFPIVGIGASAGGLAALRTLLEAMPNEPGIALVIIQHLDPTKKSLTPELLAKCTAMEVAQVDDDPRVRPNFVYVIPPNKYLSISGGTLHLSEPDKPRGARMAIDYFLRSLADDQRQRAVGVILSGTGTDGTLGIKAVKAAGGLVIAQSPTSAEFDGMPRSAIRTGVVDHLIPPAEIPDVLIRYAQHSYVRDGLPAAPADEEVAEPPRARELESVIEFLRANTRHNFHSYNENTLVRRMRRRMCLHHIDDYDHYLQYLREHPQESDALVKDLLISVTDFFREPSAWEELSRLSLRPMIANKDSEQPIRVWVPGCATGEEPYSVAMLILEELKRTGKNCPLNLFASDIDKDAIQFARAGRYPRSIEADVPPDRLRRFFATNNDDNYYYVDKLLRESVVFAEQDLIADPPFSKLDLVCCRNLLIYLKPEVQEKIIALFHFALREGGTLFLGSAETIGRQTDLFRTLHKRWRIFRRIGQTQHAHVEIPISDLRHRHEREIHPAPPVRRETRLAHLTQQQLINILAPSAVLVDCQGRILYISGDVDPYLSLNPGVPNVDLLDHARRGMRSKLRVAIQQALREDRTVQTTARVRRGSTQHSVAIAVRVIHDGEQDEDLVLVMFAEDHGAKSLTTVQATARMEQDRQAENSPHDDLDDHAVIRLLEEELAATKDDLQATVEQLEADNEEVKAANEEVMSINEELQSTNEELETSKEELQSLNEELSTVNAQLSAKVSEVETKHADLQNLLSATHLATICLDTNLAIRWFTPAVQQVIRLRASDKGRHLGGFTHDFNDGNLLETAAEVLEKLTPIEDEAACDDGRTFLRRISPYRTADHCIGGVVITFFDITERKKAEAEFAAVKELGQKIVDTVRESMLVLDTDLRVVSANDSFYRTFQVSPQATEGHLVYELGNNQWDIPALRQLLEKVLPENRAFNDFEVEHHFESIGKKVMLLNGRQIDHIQRILLAIQDITEHKMSIEFIRLMIEASPVATVMVNQLGEIVFVNVQTEQLFGYDRSELEGKPAETLIPERFRAQHAVNRPAFAASPKVRPMGTGRDLYGLRKDGSEFPVDIALSPVETPQGPHVLAAIADISRRKRVEAELKKLNETLEEQVAQRTEMLKLLQDVTRMANEAPTIEAAMAAAMERICQYNGWQIGHVWRLADDGSPDMVSSGIWHVGEDADKAVMKFEEFRQLCEKTRYSPGQFLIGAVAQSGATAWVDDIVKSPDWRRGDARQLGLHAVIAFPVTVNGAVVAVLEFFSDHPARREERFMEIMPDVGIQLGHVIERKRLEKLASDASEAEQRRIGRDIHDGVGQGLTGLRYIAQTHAETLAEKSSPEAPTAQRITEWLEKVQQQLREIVRKLIPVEIDELGLEAALRGLAEQTNEAHDLVCTLECSPSIRLADATLATHIYRIAQEAVRNAVQHAEANHIRILLAENVRALMLQVDDDGVGIKPPTGNETGFGLRSMAYRASLIGATFACQPRNGGGTRVTCTVLRDRENSSE